MAAVLGAREGERRPELVPGDPSIEHAAFVVLGVLFGLFVIYRAGVVFAGW